MEKEESCAGFDLNGDLKKTRVCLIVSQNKLQFVKISAFEKHLF